MSHEEPVSPPPLKRRRIDPPKPIHLAPSIPPRPITDLEPDHFRIFSWNVNGIATFLQPSITSFFKTSPKKRERTPPRGEPGTIHHSLRECLIRWKFPQVVGLQEIKIRSGDHQTMSQVRQAVKASDSGPGYHVHFSLPRDKHNAKGFGGKVYGVALLVREDIAESCSTTEVDWDLEGRVLLLKDPEHKLAVFNVYAVNGTDNPWRGPTGNIIGTRHDKKRKFHSELQHAIQGLEQQGWNVVVAGDINIARMSIDGFPGIRLASSHAQNRADFEAKFMADGLGMHDTFRHLHGNEKKYSYRGRGVDWGASCDRVDLIMTSKACSQAIIEADILDTVLERGPSDHVPIYTTLDLGQLDIGGVPV